MGKKIPTTLEEKYFASKDELDIIRDNETLLKWEVLSRANKLGKEIWDKKFTMRKLSEDMGLPYTTTKRCLSLDNATKKSWELLRDKKISAFKLAMVCQLKSNQFQDEIVKAVIEDNLSTTKIKSFNLKNILDVNKWRHQKAVEKGYSRQSSAYYNFKNWINRGSIFILMPISSVGDKNKDDIISRLKTLKLKIDRYIKKNG